jgi:hypothetical protein
LGHDPAAGQKDVIDVGQAESVFLDLAGRESLRFVETMNVAAPEYFDTNR